MQNYAPLIGDFGIQKILLTTFRVCFVTSVVCVFLGYIVSYAMVHAGARARDVMFFFILVPLWVSGLVRAFAWLMILRQNGLANSAVQWLGLTTQPLPISYNEFAVLVGMVHYMLPYAILPHLREHARHRSATGARRQGTWRLARQAHSGAFSCR